VNVKCSLCLLIFILFYLQLLFALPYFNNYFFELRLWFCSSAAPLYTLLNIAWVGGCELLFALHLRVVPISMSMFLVPFHDAFMILLILHSRLLQLRFYILIFRGPIQETVRADVSHLVDALEVKVRRLWSSVGCLGMQGCAEAHAVVSPELVGLIKHWLVR
jgi:hypothetical protein